MSATALILVDPLLKDFAHHHFNYDMAIARAARRRGLPVRLLVDRAASAEVVATLQAEPSLDPLPFRPLGSRLLNALRIGPAWQFLHAVAKRLADLRRRLDGAVDRGTIVFMPTCDARNLAAWLLWNAGRAAAAAPTVFLMLRFPCVRNAHDPLSGTIRAGYALSLKCLDWLDPAGRIKLCTDSSSLAEQYAALTTRRIEVLPIPHTRGTPAGPARAPQSEEQRATTVVALGDVRREKGFDILVEAVCRVLSTDQAREFAFVVHCPLHATHGDMQHHVGRLAELEHDNVRLIRGFLAEEDYYALLDSADIVLLPYRREHYASRTSGPLIEAMAAGRIVIGTGQTWLGERIAEYGGGLTFDDGDATGIAAAILAAHRDRSELLRKARIGAHAVRAEHNPDNFLNRLIAIATPPAAGAER